MDKVIEWGWSQIQAFWDHKTGAVVLLAFGAVIGWRVAASFYAERISVLQERAGLPRGSAEGSDSERAIRSVLIIELMNTQDMGFTTLNGAGLLDFAKDFDVMIVAGPSVSIGDKFRDTRTAVSEPHTIVNAKIGAHIPFKGTALGAAMAQAGEELVAALKKANPNVDIPPRSIGGYFDVWREPVLVPKGTRSSDIRSLSDVRRIGGKIISTDVPVRITEDPRRP